MAQAKEQNPCWSFLHQNNLDTTCRKIEVASLTDKQIVEDAVKLFGDKGILSAPVVDQKGSLLGMVDMLDIANFVLKVCPDDAQLEADHLRTLTIAGRALAFKNLTDVMEGSGHDPLTPLDQHSPVTLAVDLFASGIHRVPVTDEKNQIVGILSQSDVIRLLSESIMMGKLKLMGNRTLRDLGLGQSGIISGRLSDRVIDLIRKLDKNSVSAVGLTDDSDNLTGNFSITDMRGLWKDVWPSFTLSAQEYLEKHHPESLKVQSVSVDETTFTDLLKLMVDSKIHRVWTYRMEKGEKHTCGVVSMTDIMRLISTLEMET